MPLSLLYGVASTTHSFVYMVSANIWVQAQLLAQDVENVVDAVERNTTTDDTGTTNEELRKMLANIFVDNASLRKQVNSVIRCALIANIKSEENEEEDEIHLQKTFLSKFLER